MKNEWREAVLDALAVTCQDFPKDTPPAVIVKAITDWHVMVNNDPRVSDSPELLLELKAAEEWMSEVAAAVSASELGCYDGPPLSGVRAAITKATGKCCDV